MKTESFNGFVYGNTAVLVDASNFFGKISLKKKIKIRTGAQETHELCWQKDPMEVTNHQM